MKRVALLLLICISFIGCGGEYSSEKLYWKAEKLSNQILANPKGTPSMQYERAIAVFRKIIEKYPQSKKAQEAQFKIGQLYIAWENFSQAVKEFDKILKNYPEETILCSNAQFAIGNCYEQQKNWQQALATYQEVFRNYKETPLGLKIPLYIAQYYTRNKQTVESNEAFRQAIVDYKKIVNDNSKSQMAYLVQDYIGLCYVSLKEWHNVIDSLQILIENYPGSPKAAQSLITIGVIYQKELRDSQNAIISYQKFLAEYPEHKLTDLVRKRLEDLKKK